MTARQAGTERAQTCVAPEAKSMPECAAALSNTTASAFVASRELEAAGQPVRERERLVVSERVWNLFFDALVDPPEPNAALRKAFAAHGRLISKTAGT